MILTCVKCKRELTEDCFGFRSKTTGKRKTECKDCSKQRDANNYIKFGDKKRSTAKAYRLARLDEIRAQQREYRSKNREALKEKKRLRYAKNKEVIRANRKPLTSVQKAGASKRAFEWNKSHSWQHQNIHHARKIGAPAVEKIDRDAIIKRDKSICHICGKYVEPNKIHLDHILPLAAGGEHTAKNLAVSCASCNTRKGNGRIPSQLRLLG